MMTYKITILDTDYTFEALPNETLLQAALRQKIPVPWGCGGGICGICLSKIVSGTMVYDGEPLALFEEDVEAGKGLICVGYARSDLVLDVPEMD
ncbi:MAG: 2Fe-2S iron-sulfur cluster-binding protein [Thiofilum sp.]|uniref:2Fe-2S iron-sulfur cluster-binding protein n=1 Tax=Thiofilum sp. TaxID=2212733 RepID=UPI0025DB3C04|nr:2Fe-2S iron-sulfur cluster-binding protein [Thiofilum sp.]MBK8452174.1 2Fe-2S iron-sulfur cluster binding domain-containing protein [Thiofilum sp.]